MPYVAFSGIGFKLQTRYKTVYPTSVIRVVPITHNTLTLAVVVAKMSIVENVSKNAGGIRNGHGTVASLLCVNRP